MIERIQLRRSKGWTMPEGAKKVDRTSRWGNPFKIGSSFAVIPAEGQDLGVEGLMMVDINRDMALALHAAWLHAKLAATPDYLDELRDVSALACWCSLMYPCHADNLIHFLNAGYGETRKKDS